MFSFALTKYTQKSIPTCLFGCAWGGVCSVPFSSLRVPALPNIPCPIQNRTTQRLIIRAFERGCRPKRRAKAIGELKAHGTAAALGEPVMILSRLGVLDSCHCIVLGFCLHSLASFASILQLSVAVPKLLAIWRLYCY